MTVNSIPAHILANTAHGKAQCVLGAVPLCQNESNTEAGQVARKLKAATITSNLLSPAAIISK